MSRGPDAATVLKRALLAMARAAGVEITVGEERSTGWASGLFVGARVRIAIGGADGASFEAWLATLAEADFALRGHFVADVVVDKDEVAEGIRRCEALVLLIEDEVRCG